MYIKGIKVSKTSTMHYIKLIARTILFLVCLTLYIISKIQSTETSFGFLQENEYFLWAISTVFIVEMCFRFFPSQIESHGCQKQFIENYIPTGTSEAPKIDNAISTALVIASWLILNGLIAALYYLKIIDQGILVLISLAYSVCDMICILFFCPFQTFMMKNKCCGTCRIYNWDFLMMFTPCILIDHPMAKILVFFATLLFIEWEIIYKLHPERFAENTNAFLQCKNCKEKLCSHKKQLQKFLKTIQKRS